MNLYNLHTFFVSSSTQALYWYINRRQICDVETFLFWITLNLVETGIFYFQRHQSAQEMKLYLTIPEKSSRQDLQTKQSLKLSPVSFFLDAVEVGTTGPRAVIQEPMVHSQGQQVLVAFLSSQKLKRGISGEIDVSLGLQATALIPLDSFLVCGFC